MTIDVTENNLQQLLNYQTIRLRPAWLVLLRLILIIDWTGDQLGLDTLPSLGIIKHSCFTNLLSSTKSLKMSYLCGGLVRA